MKLFELIKGDKEKTEDGHSLISELIRILCNFYKNYGSIMDMDIPEYIDDVRVRQLKDNLINLMKILEEINVTKLVEPECISGIHKPVFDVEPYTADALKYFRTNACGMRSSLENIDRMLSSYIPRKMIFAIDTFSKIYDETIELGILKTQSTDSTEDKEVRVIKDLIEN